MSLPPVSQTSDARYSQRSRDTGSGAGKLSSTTASSSHGDSNARLGKLGSGARRTIAWALRGAGGGPPATRVWARPGKGGAGGPEGDAGNDADPPGLICGGRGGGLGGPLAPGGRRGGTIIPRSSCGDRFIVEVSAANGLLVFLSGATSISATSSGCVVSPTDSAAGVRSVSGSGSVWGRRGITGRPGAARLAAATASETAVSAWIVAGAGSGCGERSTSRYLPITRASRHRCEVVSASSGWSSSATRWVRNARGASLS